MRAMVPSGVPRVFPTRGEDTPFERSLNALYYSAVIYVLALGAMALGLAKHDIIELYRGQRSLGDYLAAAVLLALLLPTVVAEAARRWRHSRGVRPWFLGTLRISPGHTVSSGWNQAFGREGTLMVRNAERRARGRRVLRAGQPRRLLGTHAGSVHRRTLVPSNEAAWHQLSAPPRR